MNRQGSAYLHGLGAVLLWSTVASVFKLTLGHMDPFRLVLWSSLFSFLALAGVLAARGKLGLLLSMTRRQVLASAGFGLVNPFLYYLILFKAYDLLPAQEAQPLNYTWAVTLALLSVPLLGHKLAAKSLAALVVSYAGVFVIATRGDVLGFEFSDPLGAGLALLSTIIWALYWILNTKDDRDPVAGLCLNFAFGLCYAVLAAPLMAGSLGDALAVDLPGLAGAAYVGLFEMGLTFILWLKAMKLTDSAAKVANLIFLSPFLSLVLIHFTVGEDIMPSTLAGLGLIMAGLAVQQLGARQG